MNNKEYFSQFAEEERWDALRNYYGRSSKGSTNMAMLAKNCGLSWFNSRADDTPEQFIQRSWYQITNLRGFGHKKIGLLVGILVENVDLEEFISGVPAIEEPVVEPRLKIDGWDCFPLGLSFCSSRTKSLFETALLKTPSDLVAWYEKNGDRGVLNQDNTGRQTLAEVQQIYNGWKNCNPTQLQEILPINEGLKFTLHDCILGHYLRLKEEYQSVLRLRLVEKRTLEECGAILKKTRERVRQIERLLLANVELALEYFAEEREALFREWQETGYISCTVNLSEEHQQLFEGALRIYFERSNEGKEALAQNQQEVESTVQDIRKQWSYYTDGLALNEYLESNGLIAHKERVLEFGNSRGYFSYDADSDRLRAAKARLKHPALACLKSSGRREWSAVEWLQKLKESPCFSDVDLLHLSHLYSNWKHDPDFQEFRIDFSRDNSLSAVEELEDEAVVGDTGDEEGAELSESLALVQTATSLPDRIQLIRDVVKARNEEVLKPTSISNLAPAFEENSNAKDLDSMIRSAIEEAQALSMEDTLLGFLNISNDEWEKILSLVGNAFQKQNPIELINRYPALVSYALTLAAAEGLRESDIGSGSFYKAWDSSIGWSPATPASKKQLAEAYCAALRSFGLSVGTIFPGRDLEWKGGCYLFHAAVLPHFIEPLHEALQSVQRELPLPDPDESRQIKEFAELLAGKVERGQCRLIAVLQSSVGSLLVRRLVFWHMTGDSDLFPPFILKMLEEQKSAGQETIIKRPYIIFDGYEDALFLELPAQSRKITNSNSRWIVNGRSFRADTERDRIRLSEITSSQDTEFTVEIAGLLRRSDQGSQELRSQSYTFKSGFTEERPFRIFRQVDGREVSLQDPRVQIELGVGAKYIVLLAENIEIESDHEYEECELGKTVEYEASLRSQPLLINDGVNEWRIKPKITPGIFVYRKDAQVFTAKDLTTGNDVGVNYGEDFGLTIALPSEIQTASVVFESKTSKAFVHNEEIANSASDEHLTLTDLSDSFAKWLASLGPAIHEVVITLIPSGRRRKPFQQTFWYWKGLQFVTPTGDMYLAEYPVNVEIKHREYKNGYLRFPTRESRCVLISSEQGSELNHHELEIPKPGVDVSIYNTEGEVLEVNPERAIDIVPNDTRMITFVQGGLAPVELRCGNRPIGRVLHERKSITRSLSALVADFGKVGAIHAHTIIPYVQDAPQRVIHWRTPRVFKRCLAVEEEDGEYHWELTGLSSIGLKGVRVRLYNLAEFTDESSPCSTVEVDLPEHVKHTAETPIIDGIMVEVSINSDNCYRFTFHYYRNMFLGLVHIIEMECMTVDGSGWQTLACDEGSGRLSDIRLLFKGYGPEAADSDNPVHRVFWKDLNTIEYGDALSLSISDPVLVKCWLSRTKWLVNYRYPRIVWEKSNFRLKALYRGVTRLAVDNGCESHWWQNAITGLEEHAACAPRTAIITPCLLFGAAYIGAFPRLDESVDPILGEGGLITKSFKEASRVLGIQSGALQYVQSAFDRVDTNFFHAFSSWPKWVSGQDVPLQDFSWSDWSGRLLRFLRRSSFDDIKTEFSLLEPDHYLTCLKKLSERSKNLNEIRVQDNAHWLSPYIADLNQATNILRQVSGKSYDEFWSVFEESNLLIQENEHCSLVENIIKRSCVLAFIYVSVNKGLMTTEEALRILNKNFGSDPNHSETLRFLILGAAPELFAYFFLFFTFTL